jgi:hypothetical protein
MTMRVWIVALIGCLGIGFGSGLLIGRQFPAHHYERFGSSSYLFEVSTGKLCNPLPESTHVTDANGFQLAPSTNEFAKYMGDPGPPPCSR